MLINTDYFVENLEEYKEIVVEWFNIIKNEDKGDQMIEKDLQDILDNYKDLNKTPKLKSITKNKPNDLLKMDKILYASSKNKFETTIIFKSELGTKAEFTNTYCKEDLEKVGD
ncbi:MAG: hypothetical protein ACQERX_06020 [Bacillota bacterium]